MDELEFSKTLKDLNLQIFKTVSKRHKEMGLDITPIQGTIIMTIYENEEALCQKNLESFVSCNKSTLSSILDIMEKKELIKRVNDTSDTRKKIILLTKKSKDLIEKIAEDKGKLEEKLCLGITQEEKEMMLKYLKQMLKNLERM